MGINLKVSVCVRACLCVCARALFAFIASLITNIFDSNFFASVQMESNNYYDYDTNIASNVSFNCMILRHLRKVFQFTFINNQHLNEKWCWRSGCCSTWAKFYFLFGTSLSSFSFFYLLIESQRFFIVPPLFNASFIQMCHNVNTSNLQAFASQSNMIHTFTCSGCSMQHAVCLPSSRTFHIIFNDNKKYIYIHNLELNKTARFK